MVAFTPPQNPSLPLEEAHEPRVNSLPFGDGYFQDTPDGINSDLINVTLVWENLTRVEAKAIMDFMKARGGWEHFTYALPMEDDEVTRTWKCRTWKRTKTDGNAYDVRAELMEQAA